MRMLTIYFRWLAVAALTLPVRAMAAGGGGEAIVFVADSRRYDGWQAFFTNLYNESLVQFTILTVITVPVFALLLSTLMGFLLSKTGIDLNSNAAGGH